ncbi:MAG: hypothetical protein D8M52_07080 [Chlorobi bacterium]|nr:MAG: hypothetical protein F9K28_06335 [Bacteroidota bacterium]MBL1161466.1 hypothetical protein [Chlorobiota bacterium]MBW7853977.1 hypothetical protein [Candidatus Kapabacteria bacterium]MCC6331861.1 hypothetical protein [Ignavibacteria bacterium]MBV6463992.1 hypothetical protein [Chlorobiota bacterium]
MENQKEATFPIPLAVGWAINIAAWMLFLVTSNHLIELVMALVCVGCVYVGYKHKQIGTEPFIGFLSSTYLIFISFLDAVWMLMWGLSFMD